MISKGAPLNGCSIRLFGIFPVGRERGGFVERGSSCMCGKLTVA